MSTLSDEGYVLRLPSRGDGLDQDQEYCEVELDGETRRIRFHDYDEIYKIPGLYEQIFAEHLSCNSPRVISELLRDALEQRDVDPRTLEVLDFGAGNGMVGEELQRIGSRTLVGVDLLEEAKEAAERDRPEVYDDYFAVDMTELSEADHRSIADHDLNSLVCVAALGFGDVPPAAFVTAFNLISSPGWVAFNIRDRFLEESDKSGFAQLIEQLFEDGTLVERARVRYVHRRSVSGDPLHYLALVAEKQRDIPVD